MKKSWLLTLVLIPILLVGCTKNASQTPTLPSATQEGEPVVEATFTPTSLPMAVRVNNDGVLIEEFEADLLRLQAALTELGKEMSSQEQKDLVINNYIEELLLIQGAAEAGFTASDQEVQARIDKMVADLGSQDALTQWQSDNFYTDESFRVALKRQIAAAWQRDAIVNAVSQTAEQTHARQLFFKHEANANEALSQLNNGVEFTTLAFQQDRTLGGDLGWFPRGMLTQPEVEEAAFALQVGETSGVIKSSLGYHILNIIDRNQNQPLSTEARLMLQQLALDDWIEAARAKSTIEILVP